MENITDIESLKNNISNIREHATNAIIDTSLYYEDLIEEYVHNNLNRNETEIFSEALRTGKQEWYNKHMELLEKTKDSFKQFMDVSSKKQEDKNNQTKPQTDEKDFKSGDDEINR